MDIEKMREKLERAIEGEPLFLTFDEIMDETKILKIFLKNLIKDMDKSEAIDFLIKLLDAPVYFKRKGINVREFVETLFIERWRELSFRYAKKYLEVELPELGYDFHFIEQEAEDIADSVIVKLLLEWRKKGILHKPCYIKAWVKSEVDKRIQQMRKINQMMMEYADEKQISVLVIEVETAKYLSPKEKNVILLYLKGYSPSDIAEILKIRREYVDVLKSRAIKKLRKVLKGG